MHYVPKIIHAICGDDLCKSMLENAEGQSKMDNPEQLAT